jgi:hypothetical protein
MQGKCTKLIWGYADGLKSDLGVHRWVWVWFGGTQVSKGWEPLTYGIHAILPGECW